MSNTTDIDLWFQTADRLEQHALLEGYWPDPFEKARRGSPGIRALGTWLDNQRSNINQLNPGQRERLDAIATKVGFTWVDETDANLGQLETFLIKNRQRPTPLCNNQRSRLEGHLAGFLTHIVKNPRDLTPVQRARLQRCQRAIAFYEQRAA